jgi:CRP/FNR family transcriptional regulator
VLCEEDVEALDRAKTTRVYGKGDVIFRQGDECTGMYCTRSGTVAVRKTDDHGNAILLFLVHEGETLGTRAFFGGTEYAASADALIPTVACHIPAEVVYDLLRQNASLDLQFLRHISQVLAYAEEIIMANTSLPVRARLAQLLVSLAERYGKDGDDGTTVMEIPMTRHDMAELLATRPETVARTITALERDGLVSFSGRRAVIPDLGTLIDEVNDLMA